MLEEEIEIDEATVNGVLLSFNDLRIIYYVEPQNGGEVYNWEIYFNGEIITNKDPWFFILCEIAEKNQGNAIDALGDNIEPFNPREAYGV
jgi:hypothetical protein